MIMKMFSISRLPTFIVNSSKYQYFSILSQPNHIKHVLVLKSCKFRDVNLFHFHQKAYKQLQSSTTIKTLQFSSSHSKNQSDSDHFSVLWDHVLFFLMLSGSILTSNEILSYSESSIFSPSLMSTNHDSNNDNTAYKLKVQKVITELKNVLHEDRIETNLDELIARGKPWNSYHSCDRIPDIIIYPETTDEVSKILKVCNTNQFPVIAFGGGTSIEGHTLATKGGLSLDMNRMKKIITFHEEDLDMTVEAGIGYLDLNNMLKEKNLWFPLDPGPGASIGGMCACRCSGSTAVRYGSMRENVLSLTAVLADGTIIQTGHRARKSSAGYDITRLLIGSEGTLAIITEITLKLHGIPKISHALRISFPGDHGIYSAASTAKATLNCGVTIGRCELMDDKMIDIINLANYRLVVEGKQWPAMTTLLYEIPGVSEESVKESTEIISSIAKQHGAHSIDIATLPDECKEMWKMRKEALWSIMSQYPDREPLITDVCVPLSELPGLIQSTKEEIDKLGIPCPIVAHAGDGNFHVVVMFNRSDPIEVEEVKKFTKIMAMKAIALGGTCTGEHGVGTGKKELLRQEMGEGTMSVASAIKVAMDPNYILNPDKVIDLEISKPLGSNHIHSSTHLCS